MIAFRNILVPVDGSENSQRALAYAAYLAELCHASVGILYVVNISGGVASFAQFTAGGYIPEGVLEALQESGQVIIDDCLKLMPSTIRAKGFLETGTPHEFIVAFSAENNYDLIIMGRRGLGAIKEFMLGSVSNHVLHHAHCPVLIVR